MSSTVLNGLNKFLRIGGTWYKIDLLFFHCKLKCLVVIDLKVEKFTPADAGQMHMYLNYAKAHGINSDENHPVGLILCAEKDSAVAKYALEGLPNKVLAAEYKLNLPAEKILAKEVEHTKKMFEKKNSKINGLKRTQSSLSAMAILIGNMRGRLGNLFARTLDGKAIRSAIPSRFNVNNNSAVTEVRQKFSVIIALAKSFFDSCCYREDRQRIRYSRVQHDALGL